MKPKKFLLLIFLLISFKIFAQKNKATAFDNSVQDAVFAITMVMMHDVVAPTGAARYYAYCTMGAYEIVSYKNDNYPDFSAFNATFPKISIHEKEKYSKEIAAVSSIYYLGIDLLPSGYLLEDGLKKFEEKLVRSGFTKKEIETGKKVGKDVAAQVLAWTRKDGYNLLSAKLRYTPKRGEAFWYPTPPAYMEAVDPHWKTVRTIFIDSCNQFVPKQPTEFSKDSTSNFYKIAKEVFDAGNSLTPQQLEIAAFWDCNPFVLATSGHMSLGYKKISPGGHWMSIAGLAAKKAKLDFDKTVVAHAIVGSVLHDAFISCWDEKYRSNRIRPETFINRYIDVHWKPILQTPPFPEYTSGHSVVSSATATTLTYLFGDNFGYTDNTEEMFELAPRNFTSFKQAAGEAAISRLYGGIHYRDAVENGQAQGYAIGDFIVAKIKNSGLGPFSK